MTTTEFKIGDKVRYIYLHGEEAELDAQKIYTVRIVRESANGRDQIIHIGDVHWGFYGWKFALAQNPNDFMTDDRDYYQIITEIP